MKTKYLFGALMAVMVTSCTAKTNEPGCAVIQAVEQDQIAISRYQSYLSILGNCTENKSNTANLCLHYC